MRALRWSAGAIGVDSGGLYALGSPGLAVYSVPDGDVLWINDGVDLLSASNSVVAQDGFVLQPAERAVRRRHLGRGLGGRRRPPRSPRRSRRFARPMACRRWSSRPRPGCNCCGSTSSRIAIVGAAGAGEAFLLASGDNTVRQAAGSQFVGFVRSATHALDQPGVPTGLLSCTAASTAGSCASGPLVRLDIAAPATSTTLGTLAAASASMRADLTAGLTTSIAGQTFLPGPGGLAIGRGRPQRCVATGAGRRGSLARVTTNLP